jgi:hypothetical protein
MLTSNYFDCRRVSLELVLTEASANILQDFFHSLVVLLSLILGSLSYYLHEKFPSQLMSTCLAFELS